MKWRLPPLILVFLTLPLTIFPLAILLWLLGNRLPRARDPYPDTGESGATYDAEMEAKP